MPGTTNPTGGWACTVESVRCALTAAASLPGSDAYTAYLDAADMSATRTLKAYAWCTGEGAPILKQAGIDPDLIPPPPSCTITAAGTMVTVSRTGAPIEARRVLAELPDGPFVPRAEHLEGLRLLVSHYGYVPSDNATRLLRRLPKPAPNPAAAPGGKPAIVPADSGNGWVLRNMTGDNAKKAANIPGVRWNPTADVYEAPPESYLDVARFAAASGIPTPTGMLPPLDFDGTVDGLRGIDLSELRSIPPSRRKNFHTFGVHNAYDIIHTVPRRYLDRSQIGTVATLTEGSDACIVGTVTAVTIDNSRRMARIAVRDTTGTITATYFNAAWQGKRFKNGDTVTMYGKPERYNRTGAWSMVNPILDPYTDTTTPVIPIYPQSSKSGVTTWHVRRVADEILTRIDTITDPVPQQALDDNDLIDRWTAIRHIHFPPTAEAADEARRRIAFDELFRMQTALLLTKNADSDQEGVQHRPDATLTGPFIAALPYPLTGAQTRAAADIDRDLTRPHPMHRLLQGDVGAGKTVMALYTLLSAVESGHQGALMAPTEILARQLYAEVCERITGLTKPDGTPLVVEFFTNRLRGRKKTDALARLANGDIDIAVGTHALLADDVQFACLGAAVIDEQHRFGVEQRATLRSKGPEGAAPDLLIMTATPIPRTSAMTVFGDLDVTVLDELPPGRSPVTTRWFDSEPDLTDRAADPWRQVRNQVAAGRQVFVVCPLIEESEKMQAASAMETYTDLRGGALAGLRLGLVHGQQKPDERDATMAQFRDGEIDVLVATTVIEVGVNIPNATVMVVLDAARFGISQLHQLRGRVGRGSHQSFCFLVGRGRSSDSRARLEALESTTDGFALAEHDLAIRSHGTIFGAAQSGAGDLLVADLRTDRELLAAARETARRMLNDDVRLNKHPTLRAEVFAALPEEARTWLGRN